MFKQKVMEKSLEQFDMKLLISMFIGNIKDHFLIDIVDINYSNELDKNFKSDGILIMKESMKEKG